jgi:hypothetical protein
MAGFQLSINGRFWVSTEDGVRQLLFVEAKAGPYIFSARSNSVGMQEPGFNSAINGQLSLKYRLACALERAEPNAAAGGCVGIAESAAMLRQADRCLCLQHKGRHSGGIWPQAVVGA